MRCVLDTETTGLPSAPWARVMELGAVLMDADGREVDVFHSMIKPDIFDERCDRALAYCGLERADFNFAPFTEFVRDEFHGWCRDNSVTEVWAYNRSFDEAMLLRSGFALPWAGCVMRLARAKMPPRPKDPPLREASEFFLGEPPKTQHRALDDARSAARVLAALSRF
jgi:DNA polymerase III epsilon subunit-like protein